MFHYEGSKSHVILGCQVLRMTRDDVMLSLSDIGEFLRCLLLNDELFFRLNFRMMVDVLHDPSGREHLLGPGAQCAPILSTHEQYSRSVSC